MSDFRIDRIEFRDWECLICGNVDETVDEANAHAKKEHPEWCALYEQVKEELGLEEEQ